MLRHTTVGRTSQCGPQRSFMSHRHALQGCRRTTVLRSRPDPGCCPVSWSSSSRVSKWPRRRRSAESAASSGKGNCGGENPSRETAVVGSSSKWPRRSLSLPKGKPAHRGLKAGIWTGTGFIIHPDGWIAPNGHVVEPFLGDEAEHRANLRAHRRQRWPAVGRCRVVGIRTNTSYAGHPSGSRDLQSLRLNKKLYVNLPHRLSGAQDAVFIRHREGLQPSIEPALLPKDGRSRIRPCGCGHHQDRGDESPHRRLARAFEYVQPRTRSLHHRYPGRSCARFPEQVVPDRGDRDLRTRLELQGRYQRAADPPDRRRDSWGNSGGPALSWNDAVIGVAHLYLHRGRQAIQASISSSRWIPFMRSRRRLASRRNRTVRSWKSGRPLSMAYFQGVYMALHHVEAADKILPTSPMCTQLRGPSPENHAEHPSWIPTRTFSGQPVIVVAAVGAIASVAFGVRTIRKRRRMRRAV